MEGKTVAIVIVGLAASAAVVYAAILLSNPTVNVGAQGGWWNVAFGSAGSFIESLLHGQSVHASTNPDDPGQTTNYNPGSGTGQPNIGDGTEA